MWKNSFMDNLPLSDNMRYCSGYYKPCTGISDGGWCNIPKKADKFSPKEQMIVAYHNTHVVYAYKGHTTCVLGLIGTLTMPGVEEF